MYTRKHCTIEPIFKIPSYFSDVWMKDLFLSDIAVALYKVDLVLK